MKHLKLMGLCLAAAFALSAFGMAASAWAKEENPTWRVCEEKTGKGEKWEDSACTKGSPTGKFEVIELKGAGETRSLTAEAMGTPRLDIGTSSPDDIECSKVKFNKEAKIMGGEPGTAEETFEYSGCKVEGHEACKVNAGTEEGSLKTSPLTSKEVFRTKEAAEKRQAESTDLLVKPISGSVLYKVEISGEGCPKSGTFEISGEELYNNGEAEQHLKAHDLESSTASTYWFNSGGKLTEGKVAALKTGGGETVEHPIIVILRVIAALVVLAVWLFN
ncbi:MAG TPA: hypothetical protein VNY52_08120 [Solirubrobacteraceae bacterium]|jgi:hypothetical protein|nr:hypothetical protein [Solirubrobacteraceae bacterium]